MVAAAVAVSRFAAVLAADGPTDVVGWFREGPARARSGAIPDQIWLTLWHSGLALAVAVAVAVPAALVLAHLRRGELVTTWFVNLGRAIPIVTIVGLLVIVSLRTGYGFEPWPIVAALVLMALPPVFTNTYAAVRGVDPGSVSAARGLGFTEAMVMTRVELPLALPVVLAGVRTAAVQVLATEPIAAFFGAEGLGAYIRQGLANDDIYQVQAGALLVTAVATGADAALALLTRALVPRGIRRAAAPARNDRRPELPSEPPLQRTSP